MSNMLLGRLLVASAAFALAACGGGGSDAMVASAPPPPPPPPPPQPPPPPPFAPAIFPGVTTDTNFAVRGLEAASHGVPASSLERNGYSVRYDVAAQGYIIDFPASSAAGKFMSDSQDEAFWHGWLAGTNDAHFLSVYKPSSSPTMPLTYTSFGVTSGYYTADFGFFAFGMATPGAGVPVTGSASYNALIWGSGLDQPAQIRGGATFQFDFAAGTLSGQMNPTYRWGGIIRSLGTYTFVNTVFGVGSPSFSGSLSHAGTNSLGAFDGLFTGPTAQELMARWNAPYLNPDSLQWGEMFGIMVGKKQ